MKATIDPVPWAAGEASDQTPEDKPAVPVSVRATVRIDPQRAGPGADPIVDGAWELMVRLSTFGVGRIEPAVAAGDARGPEGRPASGTRRRPRARRRARQRRGESLRLEVAPSSALLAGRAAGRGTSVSCATASGSSFSFRCTPARKPDRRQSRSSSGPPPADGLLDGVLRPWREQVVLDLPSTGVRGIPDGTYPVLAPTRRRRRRDRRSAGHGADQRPTRAPDAGHRAVWAESRGCAWSVPPSSTTPARASERAPPRHPATTTRAPNASGGGASGAPTGTHPVRAAPHPCRTCSSATRGTTVVRAPVSARRAS